MTQQTDEGFPEVISVDDASEETYKISTSNNEHCDEKYRKSIMQTFTDMFPKELPFPPSRTDNDLGITL